MNSLRPTESGYYIWELVWGEEKKKGEDKKRRAKTMSTTEALRMLVDKLQHEVNEYIYCSYSHYKKTKHPITTISYYSQSLHIYVNDMCLRVNSVLLQFTGDVKMFRSIQLL